MTFYNTAFPCLVSRLGVWSGLDLLESVLDIVRQTALGLDRLQLARVRFTSHLHLLVDPAPFNTLHFSVSMCSNLEPPQNGNIVTTSTQFGGKATYSCTEGYQLEGDEVRTCQANGFWSGSAPFCSSKRNLHKTLHRTFITFRHHP